MAYREWQIRSGEQLAVICARGGALRNYQVGDRAVIDGFEAAELPPAFNGAVLAPWPNRVRDGRWDWQGAPQQLAITEPDRQTALHGLVAWADWQLGEFGDDWISLQCRVPAQPGYPFDLQLTVDWSLTSAGLRCDLGARNLGAAAAPFGVATHPFFGFADRTVDDLTLTMPASSWLQTDERLLPHRLRPVTGGHDFRGGRPLSGISLDTAFTDLALDADGRSSVELRGPDGATVVWADEQFGWWQIYTSDMFDLADPRYRRSVAIEAMTCGPDAFNTGQHHLLLPGAPAWRGSWGVTSS